MMVQRLALLLLVAPLVVMSMMPVLAQQSAQVAILKGDGASQACVTAGNCFDPSKLSVSPGTSVTWTNNDQVSHTVTSGNPNDNQTGTVFDSSLIAPGKTFTFTFKDAGTFHYFCQVHPWMAGEVVVGAGSTSASAPEFGQMVPAVLVASMGAVLYAGRRIAGSLR